MTASPVRWYRIMVPAFPLCNFEILVYSVRCRFARGGLSLLAMNLPANACHTSGSARFCTQSRTTHRPRDRQGACHLWPFRNPGVAFESMRSAYTITFEIGLTQISNSVDHVQIRALCQWGAQAALLRARDYRFVMTLGLSATRPPQEIILNPTNSSRSFCEDSWQ